MRNLGPKQSYTWASNHQTGKDLFLLSRKASD